MIVIFCHIIQKILFRVLIAKRIMCGIFLCISKDAEVANRILNELEPTLNRRGPDSFQRIDRIEQVHSKSQNKISSNLYITFAGSVLWLRGKCPQSQPLIDGNGGILLWNGDVFGGFDVAGEECDTSLLSEKLSNSNTNIPELMSSIQGPYAFLYYQTATKKLWFGRDFFGRHSLLISKTKDCIILSSVMSENSRQKFKFVEIPAEGIYQTDIEFFDHQIINMYPYLRENSSSEKETTGYKLYSNLLPNIGNSLNVTYLNDMPDIDIYKSINLEDCKHENIISQLLSNDKFSDFVETFREKLLASVHKRVISQPGLCKNCVNKIIEESKGMYSEKLKCTHPKISVLFSGGLDSAVLAALVHLCLPKEEELDLINVAFEQPVPKASDCSNINKDSSFNVPDRQTGIIALEELQKAYPERKFNFVMVNVEKSELIKKRNEHIKNLLFPLDTVLDDSIGCAIWFAARGEGILFESDNDSKNKLPYQSSSRVIILGMGADEQLGGYSRHRNRYRREGFDGLLNEIRLGKLPQ